MSHTHGRTWAWSVRYMGVVSLRKLPLGQGLQGLHQQGRMLCVHILHPLHTAQARVSFSTSFRDQQAAVALPLSGSMSTAG